MRTPIAKRQWSYFALALSIWCSAASEAEPGLDSPQPIAPFLNGKFPVQAPGGSGGWAVYPTFTNLTVPFATSLIPYPGSTTRLVVTEKRGRILTFVKGMTVSNLQTLLDIQSKIYNGGPCGLMNIAFHPQFGQTNSPNRGYFYVLYKHQPSPSGENAYWRLSRFTLADGATTALPSSELILINQFDRDQSHDPGCIFFGPDGFLYFGAGDEGDANDSFNVAQQLNGRLFSGIFRIDVDNHPGRSHPIRRQPAQIPMPAGWGPSFTQHYSIPNDNPFVDPSGGTLEEFLAFGLRNPFRFTYDPVSDTWLTTDVGQSTREELSVLHPGGNYGWPFREGNVTGPRPVPPVIGGTLYEPIWTYGPDSGACIIGGPVYRGLEHGSLKGKFLAVDNMSGRIWAVGPSGSPVEHLTTMPSGSVYSGTTSLATDSNGEPYFLKINGTNPTVFYRLGRTGAVNPEPPATLSALGAFSSLVTLQPSAGVIPYDVNSPLWSDGSTKYRWIALPNDGTHDSPAEKISFKPEQPWKSPPGTIFIKHFELPVDERNPSMVKRLETRFLVISTTGEPYGVTYRWRADGSDADLIANAEDEVIDITTMSGATRSQTWTYPARTDCMVCHNGNSGHVLGVNTHQMNRDFSYALTGRNAGQLETFSHLGWFDSGYRAEHLHLFPRSRHLLDFSAPLETRVRSYLDANCSQCHRPNGVEAHFDARFTTPLARQNLIHGTLHTSLVGGVEAVILPGAPEGSVALLRASMVGNGQMPPLARRVVDENAVAVIQEWIESLDDAPFPEMDAPASTVGPFMITIDFKQAISGLNVDDVAIRGGRITALSGGPQEFVLAIQPLGRSQVSVSLPAGAVMSLSGQPSFESTTVVVPVGMPGLVSWLKLDETSGNTAVDSWVLGNSGIVSGTGQDDWLPGWRDGALNFDTQGARVTLSQLLTADYSISFWMKSAQLFPQTDVPSSGAPMFHADAPAAAADWMVSGTRSPGGMRRISFQTGYRNGSANAVLHSEVAAGTEWTHIAITRQQTGGGMKIYVNGQLAGSATGSPDLLDAAAELVIGTNPRITSMSYNGQLDEVRLFGRVLTPAEIQTLVSENQLRSFDEWVRNELPGLGYLQDPSADPDVDGHTLFAEWAFGGSALYPEQRSSPLTIARLPSGLFQLSFPALEESSGLGYALMRSDNLRDWQNVGSAWTNVSYTPASPPARSGWLAGDYSPDEMLPNMFFKVVAEESE